MRQEAAFRKNAFGFARSVCSLTNHLNSSPEFSSEDCYAYFQDSYSLPSPEIQVLPDWIQQQLVSLPFILAPMTPSKIKRTLKLCSNSSTPGEDRITYGILKNLSTTHHFLATLFSKIFLNSSEAPPEWMSASITLLFKKGD